MKRKPAITRVNNVLKANGREERLVRGRGYYYLLNFAGSSMLTVYRLGDSESDYALALDHVTELLKREGVTLLAPQSKGPTMQPEYKALLKAIRDAQRDRAMRRADVTAIELDTTQWRAIYDSVNALAQCAGKLLAESDHAPLFAGRSGVKGVREAAKFLRARDDLRKALGK